MRSRYSAYVEKAFAHLANSLSAVQRKDYAPDDAKQWAEKSEWQGLEIIRTEKGGPDDTAGLVEFVARFAIEGKPQEYRETALFERENGRWVYAGQTPRAGYTYRRETPKTGRNDPCPCGSGKKYKKCCGVNG